MQIFFSKVERKEYLGFDDHKAILFGVPFLALLSALLFLPIDGGQMPSGNKVFSCFRLGALYTVIYWTIIRTILINLRMLSRLREKTNLRIFLTFIICIATVFAVEIIASPFFDYMRASVFSIASPDPPLFFSIAASFILIAAVVASYESAYYAAKFRKSQIEKEKISKSQMQTQFNSLRNQLNPHFLFNSLNTLTNLIPEDPKSAVTFVQRLSSVYRRILEHSDSNLIPLHEEINALENYLFLMQARFEHKLKVNISIGEEHSNDLIIPLALQMLVENAIKHNIISEHRPLDIQIYTQSEAIFVSNNLQLKIKKEASTGIGLYNIKERYKLLTKQSIQINETEEHYTVKLPLIPVNQVSLEDA